MSSSKTNQLFDLLDKWRHYPAYQLERRADIFVAIFLKQIFESKYQVQIDHIIPEFPVNVKLVHPNSGSNKSYKIDYVLVDKSGEKVFLVELKTDLRSKRETQDEYLLKAKEVDIIGLIDGIKLIYRATSQKNKYDFLIAELIELGWLKRTSSGLDNKRVRINPEIVYIQPQLEDGDDPNTNITFAEIRTILSSNTDELSQRFCKSLEQWEVDPNKKRL